MDTEWMGRYRGLIASLVRHGNVAIRTQTNKKNIGDRVRNVYFDMYEEIAIGVHDNWKRIEGELSK